MLDIVESVQEYFDGVKAYAEEIGLKDDLQKQLGILDSYAEHGDRGKTRCKLFQDFAPHSFRITMERRNSEGEYRYWWHGGLIFHGPHDDGGSGAYPTLSVSIEPCHGWRIHS